ncbi:MAG: hypothetical protein CSB33_03580 [Desulfobacterales bacterium]|nr:MAG: hypothetical protein CSB33_03580 [Desulfobacterales bacterium]
MNTFQIILYEKNNEIRINYLDATSFGAEETTAGIQDKGGEDGLQYPQMDIPGTYRNLYVHYSEFTPEDMNAFYFPHIVSNGVWESEICIVNADASESLTGTFKAYDHDGGLITGIKEVMLAPKARMEMTVSEAFPKEEEIAYIKFETYAETLAGYLKLYDEERRVALPVAANENSGDIYVPHIASNEEWKTELVMINTLPETKKIRIEFNTGAVKHVYLKSNECQAVAIRKLFNYAPQPDIRSAVIRDAEGLVALDLFEGEKELGGVILTTAHSGKLYFPHIASNEYWWTGIVAYNPSSSPTEVIFHPFSGDGKPLGYQSMQIQANDNIMAKISDLGMSSDTAWFYLEASRPITGLGLFGTETHTEMASYRAVDESHLTGVFPKLDKEGWTGLAFINPGNQAAVIELKALDDTGVLIASEALAVQGGEKKVALAEDLFSSSIEDAAYIRYESSMEILGIQLNGSSDRMMLDGVPAM